MANWLTDAWFYVATGKTASAIEAETAANNAILDKRNADLLERGVWTQKDQAASDQQRAAEDYWRQPGYDVAYEAKAGAIEGAQNVVEVTQEAVKATAEVVNQTANAVASTTAGFVWRAVPWWLWIAVLVWGAWQLGLVKKGLGLK